MPPPQRIGAEGKQANAEQRITSLEKIGRNRENLRRLVGHLSSRGSVIPFVGAGLSIPLKLPGWTDFLTDQAKNVGAERIIRARLKAGQYEEAAEDLERAMTAFGLHAAIEECYGDHNIEGKALTGPVTLLPALAKGPVIPTNFDRMVEKAFADASVPLQPVIAGAKPDLINRMIVKASRGLVKIHGDCEERAARVLEKAEYDEHYGLASAGGIDLTLPLPRLLSHILAGHSLLFVGCSLNRDRTVGTLEKVASVSPEIVHFAILEQPASALKEREKAKFLAEHNILPIWFAPVEHPDIEAILTYLAVRMQSVAPIAFRPATLDLAAEHSVNAPVLSAPPTTVNYGPVGAAAIAAVL